MFGYLDFLFEVITFFSFRVRQLCSSLKARNSFKVVLYCLPSKCLKLSFIDKIEGVFRTDNNLILLFFFGDDYVHNSHSRSNNFAFKDKIILLN